MREARGSADVGVAVRYRRGDGRFVGTTLAVVSMDDVLAGLPVRDFRAYQGRRHYSGWYWASTTGSHVIYESRLDIDHSTVYANLARMEQAGWLTSWPESEDEWNAGAPPGCGPGRRRT